MESIGFGPWNCLWHVSPHGKHVSFLKWTLTMKKLTLTEPREESENHFKAFLKKLLYLKIIFTDHTYISMKMIPISIIFRLKLAPFVVRLIFSWFLILLGQQHATSGCPALYLYLLAIYIHVLIFRYFLGTMIPLVTSSIAGIVACTLYYAVLYRWYQYY